MVKRQHETNVDRYMTEYKMRTPYATPTPMQRSTSDQRSARSTHEHSAHKRSHARNDPTDAFYHSEGRIEKNSRTKKTYPESNNHYQREPIPPVTTTTKSSCCTIL